MSNVKPRIEILPEKKFVGKKMIMSFAENKTFELWKSFMPVRKEIKGQIGNELYSIEIFPSTFFDNFSKGTEGTTHNKKDIFGIYYPFFLFAGPPEMLNGLYLGNRIMGNLQINICFFHGLKKRPLNSRPGNIMPDKIV